ncbi:helix-hairpin-helix domain-containing protein, partial [Pseudooceanicola lipolyticus]
MTATTEVNGVGVALAALLKSHGFDSAEAIAAATPEELSVVPRIGALRAPVLIAAAREIVAANGVAPLARPAPVTPPAPAPA